MIKYISDHNIKDLKISPTMAMEWVAQTFKDKNKCFMPHKLSITFGDGHFFNTMPSIIPSYNAMGVKVVNRYPSRTPTIDGQILYYDYSSGNLTHIIDAFWITNARTGAVCATAVNIFAKKDFETVAIMGLGNTARASISCILESNKEKSITLKILKYKDQCEKFIADLKEYTNVKFEICDTIEKFIRDSDVVISCITNATTQLAKPDWFKDGSLLVPVHTKGFQECDLVFDKVFADDTSHVENFKYFDKFKKFAEISDVLCGNIVGRENNTERIISYNIGISLHDISFSKHILDIIKDQKVSGSEIETKPKLAKFTF